ncbi:MAG: lipoyl synthase [Prolixibacteraceae bacterium]|jgi:lipoic acid synthetase|nr:lipoyl synthase [Prolixibacteraceae bacterium]
MEKRTRRLPDWMKTPMPGGKQYLELKKLTLQHNLNTICSSGNCPNRSECWGAGTASFMILGNKCTRNCRFCDVPNMIPDEADWNEPKRLAKSIKTLKLKHCVITSVARDDMDDGGAAFWAKTIEVVKELNPSLTLEVLIPDFDALPEDIQKVIDAKPEVISHNLETVRRLSTKVRDRARYSRSLTVLKQVVENGIVAKSGIMLGLGETHEEILQTMDDLRKIGCKVMTLGQYLAPSEHHLKIENFVEPELFKQYKEEGLKRGFTFVESSPLVRSSYHAELHVNA